MNTTPDNAREGLKVAGQPLPDESLAPHTTPDSLLVSQKNPEEGPTPNITKGTKESQWSRRAPIILGVIAFIALVVGAWHYSTSNKSTGEISSRLGGDFLASLSDADPVARVNGVPVSKAQYAQQLKQAEAVLTTMGGGAQLSDAAFVTDLRGRVLDDLINAELLYQAAMAAKVNITDERVAEELETVKKQVGGEEMFETQLATIGLTEDSLKDMIRRQLAIEEHLTAKFDPNAFSFADAELRSFYDAARAQRNGTGTFPTFEEAKEQIRYQLSQEKTTELVRAYVDELRNAASIEEAI